MKGRGLAIDQTQFENVSLSAYFQHFSELIAQRWNLNHSGGRTLIDLYLLEACGHLQENHRLTVFPEQPLTETQGTQAIDGNINYAVGTGIQENLFYHKIILSQGNEQLKTPYFCLVEAKKEEHFGEGRGETLAGMKALWEISKNRPINGALTDGKRWIFYRLLEDGVSFLGSVEICHPKESKIIAGMLQSMIQGALPACCSFEE